MPFFTADFTESLSAPATEGPSLRDQFVSPNNLGKTVPNPLRVAILSSEPLCGYDVWLDKHEGGVTKRVVPGGYPSKEKLDELEVAVNGRVAKKKDYETQQITEDLNINQSVAFFVWDYAASQIKILNYTQKSVMGAIARLTSDPDYSDLTAWDLELTKNVVKAGGREKTTYECNMKPAIRAKDEAVAAQIKAAWEQLGANGGDLMTLTTGGNPFGSAQ